MSEYHVIGLMSGTSLDGLDLAYCSFEFRDAAWKYTIHQAQTVRYDKAWKNKLGNAYKLSAEKLAALDAEFGRFMGSEVKKFVKKFKINGLNFISSHGHTVFHQPEKGFTLQIGSGAALAATAAIKTICDFRSGDVALGGQGAPLVPIGDKLLFSEYDACLNLGGIANISLGSAIPPSDLSNVSFGSLRSNLSPPKGRHLRAFDICPVNTALNYLADKKGLLYDKGGHLAMSGQVNWKLLKRLNVLPYYQDYKSKSIGREWIAKYILSTLDKEKIALDDKLATASEHAALQIGRTLNHFKIKKVLITGGGAYNTDLISRIAAYSSSELVIPDKHTIEFKEALIFALLGVLRERGEVNCLKEVTGASRDSVGGAIYLP